MVMATYSGHKKAPPRETHWQCLFTHSLPCLSLIKRLPCQVWYADDATATGKLHELRQWWSKLANEGPNYGYFANPTKSWLLRLLVKEEHEQEATTIFEGLGLKITTITRSRYWLPQLCRTARDQEGRHLVRRTEEPSRLC